MEGISEINDLYRSYTGASAESITLLSADGSNRKYFRIHGNPTLIGTVGINTKENEAFIKISAHLHSAGINVPEVSAVSPDRTAYLQDDLGDISLFDMIKDGRTSGIYSDKEKALLREAMRILPAIQHEGAKGFDFSVCYPTPEFDRRSILWDLNYFKYCFLKTSGIDFYEDKLEDDFESLADTLLKSGSDAFMYRDFQSRNVMIKDGKPWFIDFQGGRRGPIYYDPVSFLWQAKANMPQCLRDELLKEYVDALARYRKVDMAEFMRNLRHFVLFRTLQVLGAYGFRGNIEKKEHFIQSIPFAINNLRDILYEPFSEYPYLNSLLDKLVNLKQYSGTIDKPILTVRVMSFSYRKGIPEDTSGNGGGFVFDCRGIHNPGRFDHYKAFTGLDANVKKFLEDDGDILIFLDHCYALADTTVERFMKRGFTNLMICFGCTGGRHRSVYAAQHMAEHISAKYPVRVELEHREQRIAQTLYFPK